jgi:hypothetical protein
MGSVGVFISLTALSIYSFVFIAIYAYEQRGYESIGVDVVWWFEKVAASATVIIVVIVFIYEQKYTNYRRRGDSINEIGRACDSILGELDDHIRAYNGGIHTQTRNDEHRILYTNAFLITDAFTSISRSGMFTRLNSETQNQLSNLYSRIIRFNSQSEYKFKFQDMYIVSFKTQDSRRIYEDRLRNIELYLTSLEEEIKDFLPVVRRMIEDERTRPR